MTRMRGSVAQTATPADHRAGRRLVRRFSRSERLLHWVHALAFAGLLVTGLLLYLPSVAGVLGSREAVKTVHLYVASAWLVALLLIVALGDRRGLRATVRDLELFDGDDRRWLRRTGAPQGRFNAGQKLHAALQAAFATLFLISGSLLLYGERDTRFRLDGTIILHDALTFFATVMVVGHIYLAVVHPPTRPALRGILSGSVREDWAREHHAKWTRGFAVQEHGAPPPTRGTTWLLLGAVVAVVAITLAAVPL